MLREITKTLKSISLLRILEPKRHRIDMVFEENIKLTVQKFVAFVSVNNKYIIYKLEQYKAELMIYCGERFYQEQ